MCNLQMWDELCSQCQPVKDRLLADLLRRVELDISSWFLSYSFINT